MSNNIILTGMPGAGKSTVGVILAKTVGFDFVDLDIRISKRHGMTLQEIMDTKGLDFFMSAERFEAMDTHCQRTVIATGGSVVLYPPAMEHLKQDGTVVYLDVPLAELSRRLTNIKTRGIAAEPGVTLQDIYDMRTPLYRQYADVHIACDGKNTEDIVAMIMGRIGLR